MFFLKEVSSKRKNVVEGKPIRKWVVCDSYTV